MADWGNTIDVNLAPSGGYFPSVVVGVGGLIECADCGVPLHAREGFGGAKVYVHPPGESLDRCLSYQSMVEDPMSVKTYSIQFKRV